MNDIPMDSQVVRDQILASGLNPVGLASIRELNRIVNHIETQTGEKFIRMEMGVPGLAPPRIAVDGEIAALKKGVGSKYPPFDGIPELKAEISRFVENFIGTPGAGRGLSAHRGGNARLLSCVYDVRQTDQGKG